MGKTRRPRPRFDVTRLTDDMAERGWMATDLARAAGVSDKAVSLFLRGHIQTPKMAKRFADALGKSVRRYVIRNSESASAA